MSENQSNWAGNYIYRAATVHYPETLEQAQEIVSSAPRIRALGSRHSFNDIADSPGDLISLNRLPRVLAIDSNRQTATVDAGAKYGQISEALHREGFALHNMASLPHISVAGACATATHGSGVRNGNLATAVSGMELMTAEGKLVTLSREHDSELFPGAVVSLGGLGIVTKMTLNIVPTFEMRQYVYENLPLRQLEDHFGDILSNAYSVSLFTDWASDEINQVWLKQRIATGTNEPAPEQQQAFYGATPAPTHRHPIVSLSAEPCTEQMGIPGPWYERLPHFRMGFTPSSGDELQTEYMVPYDHALPALLAMNSIRDRIAPLLQISEIRTIAEDDLWLSPCYRQPCVGIHFTWVKNWQDVSQLLPHIEEQLAPFDARPHWGKLFTVPPERVQSLYPRLPDFQQVLSRYDPKGKFTNAFLDTYIRQ